MGKTNVIMPQMGESIAEGTVVKWLKKVGDAVKRDEPLFEISTDKVDAEIPSPTSGVLASIDVVEGTTVEVNTVVGIIADSLDEVKGDGDGKGSAPTAEVAKPEVAPPSPEPAQPVGGERPKPKSPAPLAPMPSGVSTATAVEFPVARGIESKEELRRLRSTPLVRRMAREHGIDISKLEGSGISGRVTKQDLLSALETGAVPQAVPSSAPAPTPSASPAPAQPALPAFKPGEEVHIEPMSVMRRKIAEHMVMSKRTSAHVHTIYEMDCTNIMSTRKAVQTDFVARHGQKLTITPFVIKATIEALRAFPIVNASVDGDNIVYKREVNIGVAVALDWGLIVPVIRNADELSLVGINKRLADLANRARNKQLAPDEVQGGTFTVTNPGIFGSLFGTPVINQPQVAILGMGTIEKRVRVVDDGIVIRPMMYTCLSFDHRLIDGAVADQFLSHVKKTLETADFKALL